MSNTNDFSNIDATELDTLEGEMEMETEEMGMEIFVPEVLASEGQYEGTEVSRKLVSPETFTPAKAWVEFNLHSWVEQGFTYSDQVSFFPLTREENASHLVAISHVLRMNSAFNNFVPGVRDIYNAQAPSYSDKSEYVKPFTAGKDGKAPYFTGRGLVADHSFSDVYLSKHFTYAEQSNAVAEACEDILNGVQNGVAHEYSVELKVAAANAKQKGCKAQDVGKDAVKVLLKATERQEKAVNSIFSFNFADYGIAKDDVEAKELIHENNRGALFSHIGCLAQQAGVQPGQYFEMVVLGYAYKATYNSPDADTNYPHGCIDVRYFHTPAENGGLPAGVVILCRPIAEMTHASNRKIGNANSKSRLLKALGNKPVAAPTVAPKAAPAPAPQVFALPERKAVSVEATPTVASTQRRTRGGIDAFLNAETSNKNEV